MFSKAFYQLALLCGGCCLILLITVFIADRAFGNHKNRAHRILLETVTKIFILGLILAGLGVVINVM